MSINPIVQSLSEIRDIEAKREIANHLVKCYNEVKAEAGDAFDDLMSELVMIIMDLQSQCKEGTSFVAAGMLMTLPDEEDTEESIEKFKFTKAAIVWWLFEQEKESVA